MDERKCDAVVVHCIDFRLQKFLNDWLEERLGTRNYDRVALAGGALHVEAIIEQVELADRLHHIARVILINHEDCGAYGADGTLARHKSDLAEAAQKINRRLPGLAVETYYLHLDGTFERVP